MTTNTMRHIRSLALFSLAAWGSLGCGTSDLPPVDPAFSDATEGESEFGEVARLEGSFRDGRVTLRELPSSEIGLAPQGFGEFTSGKVAFSTLDGDGVGTGTCTSTQYCGNVQAVNNTGVLMDNMWVEITEMTATPAGAQVTWGGPAFTLSDAYRNFFVNSSNVQAGSYGNFVAGQAKTIEWKFNINAGSVQADNFDFKAPVYASFRRAAQSGSLQKKRPVLNACNISGSVNHLIGVDDQEEALVLPFPFTLYDVTYDRAVIGSNGYVLLYRTGSATPTAPVTNASMTALATPVGLYPFWDDLAFDAGDGVCVATSGTKPNRQFTVTWRNAKINTNQPSKGSWSTERTTYGLQLQETNDLVTFIYNLPTGGAGITALTRGSSATTGSRVIRNGNPIGADNSLNAPSAYIPATAVDYSARLVKTSTPINP